MNPQILLEIVDSFITFFNICIWIKKINAEWFNFRLLSHQCIQIQKTSQKHEAPSEML